MPIQEGIWAGDLRVYSGFSAICAKNAGIPDICVDAR